MSVVVDAGVLIRLERRPREVIGLLDLHAARAGDTMVVPATALAQVWRGGRRQTRLAQLLPTVQIAPLDEHTARQVGELLAASGSSDVVDAHVAVCCGDGDVLLTSDPVELAALLVAAGTSAIVIAL